jgi:hypothetical protein
MRAALVAVAFVAVAALGAGACGSSGEDRLSSEEYVTAADAICKDANDRIDALPDPQTKDELIAYISQARTIGDEELAALRGLSPPAELEDRANEAYELLEQQLALTDDLEQAVRDEQYDRVDELTSRGQALNDRADAIAGEIGLRECRST